MVFLHCGQIEAINLHTVDLLIRRTLRAKRAGRQARLAFANNELLALIAFVGLGAVLIGAAGFPPRD